MVETPVLAEWVLLSDTGAPAFILVIHQVSANYHRSIILVERITGWEDSFSPWTYETELYLEIQLYMDGTRSYKNHAGPVSLTTKEFADKVCQLCMDGSLDDRS